MLLKLIALVVLGGFAYLLYWVLTRKDTDSPPIDDEVIDDVPVIEPPVDTPPVEVVESEVKTYWFKIWKLAQARPPLEYMKKALSEKEFQYYVTHRSEFTLGAPMKYDALGRKKKDEKIRN